MSAVCVVSRNPSLAFGLASGDYEVTDHRPKGDDWVPVAADSDVIILDLPDPAQARRALDLMRQAGVHAPVLFVAPDDDPGWSAVAATGAGIALLPLPINRTTLLAAVDALRGWTPSQATPRGDEFVSAAPTVTPHAPTAAAGEAPGPAPVVLETPLDLASEAPQVAPSPPPTQVEERLPGTANVLGHVVVLAEAAGTLATLHEIADVIVGEAAARISSAAGALLLPDGDVWRVTGSVSLRPLEERIQLTADHWLITEVSLALHGVIVEHTDIARERLRGAPLAGRDHLLVAPVPSVRGVLLLARDDEQGAYDEDQLMALAELAREARAPLEEALELRRLARLLDDFRDPPA